MRPLQHVRRHPADKTAVNMQRWAIAISSMMYTRVLSTITGLVPMVWFHLVPKIDSVPPGYTYHQIDL